MAWGELGDMRKIFGLAVAIVALMAVAIVGWGAWLNYSDEKQITQRMDSRVVELTAARAARRRLEPMMHLDAVRFYSDTMTDAVALTEGRIVRWRVGKNDAVRKGQVIADMVNENIPLKIQQAESAISRAEAAVVQTQNSYRRQESLLAQNATSVEKYEESKANYLAAQGSLQEARVQLDQCLVQRDWLSVESPLDGEMLIIYQRVGAHVQAGTPVGLVGDFSRLQFSLHMTDAAASHLLVGQESFLHFPDGRLSVKAYDTDYGAGNKVHGTEIKAVLKEVVPPLSEPADIRRAVWEVDNRSRILEPMIYNDVTMRAGHSYEALMIPLQAMIDQSNDEVFVVDEDGMIHRRTVAPGASDGKYIEIHDGLIEGEAVVVGNLDGLEDGMKVQADMEGES